MYHRLSSYELRPMRLFPPNSGCLKLNLIAAMRPYSVYRNERQAPRVTRLGEFSPNGWFFILGNYCKITEVGIPHFWLLYSMVKFEHPCLQKLGWATFWVIFFPSSSGHPEKCFSEFFFHSRFKPSLRERFEAKGSLNHRLEYAGFIHST
jgi:hypothetical protein